MIDPRDPFELLMGGAHDENVHETDPIAVAEAMTNRFRVVIGAQQCRCCLILKPTRSFHGWFCSNSEDKIHSGKCLKS